jgi:hypothetical protein
MGIHIVIFLAGIKAKETIHMHRHIVVAEPPPVDHEPKCDNHDACTADWHAAWWNGMA